MSATVPWNSSLHNNVRSITEPQNHRIAEAGGISGDLPVPIPFSKQGQLERVAQDHGELGFQYLKRWRLHNLSGNLL